MRHTGAESADIWEENLTRSKVVSFGDAVNDIPMFQVSDEAYAVENAVEELKALATGIIDSNENNGVARWLREHAVIERVSKNENT